LGGGVYVLTSHCNFKTRVNVPHVNRTVTDLGGGVYVPIYPPSLRPERFIDKSLGERKRRLQCVVDQTCATHLSLTVCTVKNIIVTDDWC